MPQERLRLNLATSFIAGGRGRQNTGHSCLTWTPPTAKGSLEIRPLWLAAPLPQGQRGGTRKTLTHRAKVRGQSEWAPRVWSLLDLPPFSLWHKPPSLLSCPAVAGLRWLGWIQDENGVSANTCSWFLSRTCPFPNRTNTKIDKISQLSNWQEGKKCPCSV